MSLTQSDVEVLQEACQMSVVPMMVALGALPGNVALLERLLDGFRARFGTVRV